MKKKYFFVFLGLVVILFGILFNHKIPSVGQATEAVHETVKKTTYLSAGKIIAQETDGQIHFIHEDRLKSNIITTKSDGSIISENNYDPYGKNNNEPHKLDYTGKLKTKTSTINLGAREYNPQIKRFMTTDNVLLDDQSPYAYSKNNPYKYIDPDGNFAELALIGGGSLSVSGGAGLAAASAGVIAAAPAVLIGGTIAAIVYLSYDIESAENIASPVILNDYGLATATTDNTNQNTIIQELEDSNTLVNPIQQLDNNIVPPSPIQAPENDPLVNPRIEKESRPLITPAIERTSEDNTVFNWKRVIGKADSKKKVEKALRREGFTLTNTLYGGKHRVVRPDGSYVTNADGRPIGVTSSPLMWSNEADKLAQKLNKYEPRDDGKNN